MVSHIGSGYVQTIRYAMILVFALVVVADTINVRDRKQVENEWASTSKKNHKGPNTYEFRYDLENAPTNNIQYRMEERHPNGSVVGSYGQVQPDGNIKVVAYVADNNGVKTYVKNHGETAGGGDRFVAEGSSPDPVHRITSQIIQTAVQSQQTPHRSPLHDKYFRPTPSTAAVASQRVDTAHTYHQQRTNLDPASFRPVDSPGYQETHQPFVGDQLKDRLQSTHVQYQSEPQQPLFVQNPVAVHPYGQLQQSGVTLVGPQQQQQQQQQQNYPTHYMLNVPPLPSLADNSPLPLLPGQQPLPITPDRGPIMIQLQQPQQQQQQPQHVPSNAALQQYQYQPTQVHPQQVRLPPGQVQQQQLQQYAPPSSAQQYQQQPVRVQPPAHLQPQQQHQSRLAAQQQHAVQYQPQQNRAATLQAASPSLQLQQQQQNVPYQQTVMQQPYQQQQQQQQVNIPAHPSQIHVRGNVQQHQTVVPMQYFHQPNPATTAEQYRQQLQLQAAESQIFPVFMLPPRTFNRL